MADDTYVRNPHGYPQRPNDQLPERGTSDGEVRIVPESGRGKGEVEYRWSDREDRWLDLGPTHHLGLSDDDIGERNDISPEVRLDWGEAVPVLAINPWTAGIHEVGEAQTIEEYQRLMGEKEDWEVSQIHEDD